MPLPPVLESRRARRLLVALAAVVLARALLPLALELGIEWGGERASGLPIEVGDVDLALLRGGVALEDVVVAGVEKDRTADGAIDRATALVRFGRLAANLQWLSLLRGRIHLAELQLTTPVLAIELDAFGKPRLRAPEVDEEPEGEIGEAPAGARAESAESVETGARTERPAAEGDGEPADEAEDPGWPIWLDRVEISDADARILDPLLAGPGDAVRVGFEALELTDLHFSAGSVGLGGIGLRDPRVYVRRDFVLADRPAAEEQVAAESPQATPSAAAHRMERIAVERAEFQLLTPGGPLEVALQLDATGVTTARGEGFGFDLGLEIGDGELSIVGDAGIDPPSLSGKVSWRDLPLTGLALAADPALAGWLRSARASGQLDVAFGAAGDGALVLRGDANVDDFDLEPPEGDDVALRWKSLSVVLNEVVVPLDAGAGPVRLDVAEISWLEPFARYTRPAPALDALLGAGDAAADPEQGQRDESGANVDATPAAESDAPEPGDPAQVRVHELTVTGGDLRFVDRTVRPVFEGRVTRLDVTASELRLPERRAEQLHITGLAPGGASFSLDGVPDEGGRIDVDLERLDLAQFNPYVTPTAGYRLNGSASLDSEIELRRNKVDVGNHLVLHGIALESTGKDILSEVIGMPVDLALALLRDLSGNIRLGIPVSAERGEVRVSVATLLRDAARAAIAGAVMAPLKIAGSAASPLAALGSALTDGGLSIPPLDGAPGEARLAEGQAERVGSLIDFLEARPQLKLVIHGRSDPSDRDGLARRILIETVQADGDLPEVEGAGFFERRRIRGLLAAMGRGEAPEIDADDRALFDRYVAAVFVPPPRYESLARERAAWLRAELVERYGVAPARLEIAEAPETGSPGIRIALAAL